MKIILFETILFALALTIASSSIADSFFPNYLQANAVKTISIANTNSTPRVVEHRTCLWRKGDEACEIIDGHHYILTYIHNSVYGSYGIAAIVYAESCPCKKWKYTMKNKENY